MKRRGPEGNRWRRLAASSSPLVLALALAPGIANPMPAAASAAVTRAAPIAASAPAAVPQLATYAGAPAAGKPTDVAQQPYGLAVLGRYTFVADPANHLVRLLVGSSERVFAGNGSLSSEGNGNDLSRSQLIGPYAVAIGHVVQQGFQVTSFDVYIADTYAHLIRKVNVTVPAINKPTDIQTTNIITLAGKTDFGFSGDGTSGTNLLNAQLNSPYGLAWDDARQLLYVADTLNNRIRVIHDPGSTAQLTLTTVIGPDTTLPAALRVQLNHPRGLATDAAGRLYIADTYNNVVRLYDPNGASLTTVAGTGVAGFSGDGQAATKANLRQPAGVAVDGQGNLYIADTGNQVVREVTGKTIQTVAGMPQQAGKFGDGGPAILAKLSSPTAVAVRPNGDVVIADTGNNLVRILEGTLANGPAHNLHTEAGNGTASFSGEGQPPAQAQFAGPTAVVSKPAPTPINAAVPAVTGTRYIVDTFNQVVRTYATADRDPDNHTTADGDADDVATLAGLGGMPGLAAGSSATQSSSAARFANPMGMALDASGTQLYIADTFNDAIRKIDLNARTVTTVAGTPGVSGYSGDGDLATKATLSYPVGVAVDSAGDVFIADSYNGVVREVLASNKKIYTVAGTGRLGFSGEGGAATQAGLYLPYGVAVDAATPPNLYITDSFDHRVRRVTAVSPLDAKGKPMDPAAKNTITTLAGDGSEGFADGPATPIAPATSAAQFDRPWSTTLDHGNLLVADYLNHRVRQVNLTAGAVVTAVGPGSPGLDNSDPPPGPTADSGPATTGEVNGPRGISLLGDSGALLLADSFNNRIRWVGQTQAAIQRSEVIFDPTNLASSSQPQSVAVTSTGSGLLVMGNVDLGLDRNNFFLDPSKNTCAQARLEAGSSCFFQVAFQPRAPGEHAGTVVIPNDAVGVSQEVKLHGQATAALVTLSPPEVAIYQPPNSAAAPAVITLTNNGDGVLTIGSIALQKGSNSDFSQSNNCPSTMAAHGTCQITITLNQLGAGSDARTDTLVIRDDAAGNAQADLASGGGATQLVPLTGSLAQPAALLSQQSLTFTQNIGTGSASETFTMVNNGQVPLHLSAIRDDGDFSQSNNCPVVLAPGAGCAISVTFNPSTLGERDGYIVVADDSPDSPHRIPVMGIATMAHAQLGPGRLNFSQNVGATSAPQTVMLSNNGDGPLTIEAIGATGDFKPLPHCPTILLPGLTCSIGVAFAPHAAGAQNGALVVTDDANSAPGSQQSVRLTGIGHQPIASLSASVLTPGVNLGSSTSNSVTVTNTGDGALTIRAIGIAGGGARDYSQSTNCVRTIQPGASCAITINFMPHGYGARWATLTLYDDGAGGAQAIALHGTGTAPRPLLSSGYLNFGGDAVGNPSVPQSIVLFNAGNGALSIGGIGLTGGDYQMGTSCGPALAAGASCRITVTFVPQVTGPRAGLITITDSTGTQRITLSGVGT
jgi:sugar lactone lactonase YvrE